MEITPQTRQIIEDFLSDYWSIFSRSNAGIFSPETGNFYKRDPENWGQWLETDGACLYYWGANPNHDEWPFITFSGELYDSDGNQVTGIPFIRGNQGWSGFPYTAFSYSLHDLTSSEVPEVVIRYFGLDPFFEGCLQGVRGDTVIYRFIDGAFKEVGLLHHFAYRFFTTENGDIIVLHDDMLNDVHGYYNLRFTNGGLEQQKIFVPELTNEDMMEQWINHHDWDFHFGDTASIFGTNIPLTRVNQLTDLENEIRESITNNFFPHLQQVEYEPEEEPVIPAPTPQYIRDVQAPILARVYPTETYQEVSQTQTANAIFLPLTIILLTCIIITFFINSRKNKSKHEGANND